MADIFNTYPNIVLEEAYPSKKMHSSWGQTYKVEQMFEHAIVHRLRHRRQIGCWLQTSPDYL